jgi:hypothetical protein
MQNSKSPKKHGVPTWLPNFKNRNEYKVNLISREKILLSLRKNGDTEILRMPQFSEFIFPFPHSQGNTIYTAGQGEF